jgi:hypothetical protein
LRNKIIFTFINNCDGDENIQNNHLSSIDPGGENVKHVSMLAATNRRFMPEGEEKHLKNFY